MTGCDIITSGSGKSASNAKTLFEVIKKAHENTCLDPVIVSSPLALARKSVQYLQSDIGSKWSWL